MCVQLLEKKPSRRLGCGPDGINEIKVHPFFTEDPNFNWKQVEKKLIDSRALMKASYLCARVCVCVESSR